MVAKWCARWGGARGGGLRGHGPVLRRLPVCGLEGTDLSSARSARSVLGAGRRGLRRRGQVLLLAAWWRGRAVVAPGFGLWRRGGRTWACAAGAWWRGWPLAATRRRVDAGVNDVARGGLQLGCRWLWWCELPLDRSPWCRGACGAVAEALWWRQAMFQLAWFLAGFPGLLVHGVPGFVRD